MKKLPDLKKRTAFRGVGSNEATSDRTERRPPRGAQGARLIRRFVRDPRSGRLVCVWSRGEDGDSEGRRRTPPRAA